MLTKYKVLGGLIGTAAVGYGVYESVVYVNSSKTSRVVADKLPKDDPQPKKETKEKKPEAPKEIQRPQPEPQPQPINPSPAKDPQPPAPPKVNSQDNIPPEPNKPDATDPVPQKSPSDQQSDSDGDKYALFGTEDNGSIGWQFKDFLIGSKKPEKWEQKLNSWKNQTNGQRAAFHSSFSAPNRTPITLEMLQTRCQNAYSKKSWTEHLNNQGTEVLNYWSSVSAYCSQPTAAWPDNWYNG